MLIYQTTRRFPRDEMYGLTSQLRRAAVSVPSNIAEGHGRKSTKEYLNHLSMAKGSLMEMQTQLEIARRLEFLPLETFQETRQLTETVARLLHGLIRALQLKL
ncbi:MAG TPA: four helix bundle protein [Candidatus Hydrogenedentes bacterium]|nr:four helix bundle protein [Candidatus Hydrogenedentota bacterium]